MDSEQKYLQKYLKYKNKYLQLQRQIGGKCYTNVCKLKDAGFIDYEAKYIAKNSNDKEIKNIFDLINAGLIPSDAKIASDLTGDVNSGKIKIYVDLINADFDKYQAHNGANNLTGDINSGQIKNMIDLKKADIEDYHAYKGARDLTGDINSGQIKNMIDLKQADFYDDDAYKGAKELTGDINSGQIKKMIDFNNFDDAFYDTV
jgi:hypothetical protein